MSPGPIRNDDEYREARARVAGLRTAGQGSGEEARQWEERADSYDRARLPADSPLLFDSILVRLKREYPGKADPWSAALAFVRGLLPEARVAGARGAPLFCDRTILFFIAATAAVYLRLLYRTTYFPIFVEGEESKVLDLAKATVDYAAFTGSWWSAFTGGLIEYNKGYAWFLVPFYMAYGYDPRIMAFVLPAISSVLIGVFFTIYRKANPRGSLLSFGVAAMMAILCVSLRRYKWHSVASLAVLSIYIYFLPLFHAGAGRMKDSWRKGIAAALFVLSCYLYFGSLFFAVPFVLLVVGLSSGPGRRRELAGAAAGALACAGIFLAMYSQAASWRDTIGRQVATMLSSLNPEGLARRWWSTRDFFLTQDLTVPCLIIVVVGAAESWRRLRAGDKFAVVNTALLSCLWAFESLFGSLNNPDQMNWSMIPLLGLMLTGCDTIAAFLKARLGLGAALAAAAALLTCWIEARHYPVLSRDAPYQQFSQDRNTRSQVALVLRMIREEGPGPVRYFLPDPATPEAHGGFDCKAALLRVDTQEALGAVTFFTGDLDLRGKLAGLPPGTRAVAYLSVGFADEGYGDTLYLPLLGQEPEVIHPYEGIYQIPFLVRKFTFLAGRPPGRP